MGLDANIIFRGLQAGLNEVNPVSSLLGGIQTGQGIVEQNTRNQMLGQQLQQNQALAPLQQRALEQNLAQGDLQNQALQSKQMDDSDIRSMKSIVYAAQDALLLPQESRKDFLNKRLDYLDSKGIDSSDTREAIQMIEEQAPEEFEKFLGQVVAIGESRGVFALGNKNRSPVQFGGQQTFKDEKGNLFFGTTKRDPKTGNVQSVLAPIDGTSKPTGKVSMAGTYGLTADEKVDQVGKEKTEADRAAANETARQDYIKQGLTARGMIPKTQKLLELNEAITTGKVAKAKKFMQDIFGVTNPDLGQFNALAGSLVLENIRALGANPTEGERQFLTQITPSLDQGGEVNKALLNDMLEIQNRQVDRAKWFSNNKNKTVEEYLLSTDTEDFEPSSSIGDVQKNSGTTSSVGRFQIEVLP